MRLAFIGASGSGKDTQIELVQSILNAPNISTGEILKELIAKHDPAGQEIKKYVDHGWWGDRYPELDEMILRILLKRVENDDCKEGFILNGFPRTFHQAELFDKLSDAKLDKVVYFELSKEEAVKRLSNRRNCKNCGQVYHLVYNPPKKKGICDNCKSMLYQRKDDVPEIIEERLSSFVASINLILEYYKKSGILLTIDASPTIEFVHNEVIKQIRSWR